MTNRMTVIKEKISPSLLWREVKEYKWPALTFLLILLFWEFAVQFFKVNQILLPRPTQVLKVLITERVLLVEHMWITLYEILIGFILALIVGIGIAIVITHSSILKKTLYPLLIASQNIPKIAVGPLLVLWIGMGIASKAILVLLICFFPIVVNTATGLEDVPQEMNDLLRSLNASKAQIFRKIRLPNAFPHILSGMKVSITLAVIGAIMGEFIAANKGLGFLILLSSGSFNTSLMMAAIGVLVIIGIVLFGLMSLLTDILAPWRKVTEEQQAVP